MVTGYVGVSGFLSLGFSYFCDHHARRFGIFYTLDFPQSLKNESTVRIAGRSSESLAGSYLPWIAGERKHAMKGLDYEGERTAVCGDWETY